jgi:hypothetical protein
MLQRYSHLESDREPNTIVIEYSFLFSTVIYTLWYNQWFRSYDFLKLTRLLKLCSGQNWSSWEIWIFDATSNVISGNLQYQLRSYLSQLSDGYLYASIWQRFKSYDRWRLSVLLEISAWLKKVTYRLQNLGLIETRSKETLNIKVIGNFINSLKRVETQNFNTRRRYHGVLKLEGFSR